MNRLSSSLLFAVILLLSQLSSARAIPLPESREDALRLEQRVRESQAARFTASNLSYSNGVHYQRLDYSLRLSTLSDSSVEIYVTHVVTVDSSFIDEYLFNLDGGTILAVQVDDVARTWTREGELVRVSLASPLTEGTSFTVVMNYRISPVAVGLGPGMQYDVNEQILFTSGEPYDTRDWLACWDYPDAKIDTVVSTVTVPSTYKVLSNGELVSNAVNAGEQTWIWRNTDPISSYLISIAVGNYVVHDAGTAGVNNATVAYWVYPEDSTDMIYDYGRTPQMIEVFEDLFGPYPFNKYDQATAPIFGGGGAMEHQTATTYGSSLVGDGYRAHERVVAHELAHQWWGDYVGPRDFQNIWLNEGFASYSEVLFYEQVDSLEVHSLLGRQAARYFAEDGTGARFALYDPPDGYLFSSTVYVKGSRVLHMLRWEVGDSLFFEGMRKYAQRFAYGNATTAEYQEVMEEVAGRSLDDFFQQWVYSAGYPIMAFSDIEISGDTNAYSVTIRGNQTQLSAPLFSFNLPLRLMGTGGDTTVVVEVNPVREQQWNVGPFPFRPDEVYVDPDDWVLLRSNLGTLTEGALPNQFTLEPAYPNPFNSSVRSTIAVHWPGEVKVKIYNILGQEVASLLDLTRPGVYTIHWTPGPETASGIYLLRADGPNETAARRIVLLR